MLFFVGQDAEDGSQLTADPAPTNDAEHATHMTAEQLNEQRAEKKRRTLGRETSEAEVEPKSSPAWDPVQKDMRLGSAGNFGIVCRQI